MQQTQSTPLVEGNPAALVCNFRLLSREQESYRLQVSSQSARSTTSRAPRLGVGILVRTTSGGRLAVNQDGEAGLPGTGWNGLYSDSDISKLTESTGEGVGI